MDDFCGWINLILGKKHGIAFVLGIGVKRKHKVLSSYPSLAMSSLQRQQRGGFPLTVAETNGGRSLATRRRSEDPGGRARHVWAKRFWRSFQILTRQYIYPGIVGVIEWNNSVAPRCRITSGYCNSV